MLDFPDLLLHLAKGDMTPVTRPVDKTDNAPDQPPAHNDGEARNGNQDTEVMAAAPGFPLKAKAAKIAPPKMKIFNGREITTATTMDFHAPA